jgi:hypothetical protein
MLLLVPLLPLLFYPFVRYGPLCNAKTFGILCTSKFTPLNNNSSYYYYYYYYYVPGWIQIG